MILVPISETLLEVHSKLQKILTMCLFTYKVYKGVQKIRFVTFVSYENNLENKKEE